MLYSKNRLVFGSRAWFFENTRTCFDFIFFFNLPTAPNFKTHKNSDMQANVHDLIKYTISIYIYPILCKFKATFSYSFFAVPFLTILLDFVGFGRVARLYPSDFLQIEKISKQNGRCFWNSAWFSKSTRT